MSDRRGDSYPGTTLFDLTRLPVIVTSKCITPVMRPCNLPRQVHGLILLASFAYSALGSMEKYHELTLISIGFCAWVIIFSIHF